VFFASLVVNLVAAPTSTTQIEENRACPPPSPQNPKRAWLNRPKPGLASEANGFHITWMTRMNSRRLRHLLPSACAFMLLCLVGTGCTPVRTDFSNGGGNFFSTDDLYGPSTTDDILAVRRDAGQQVTSEPTSGLGLLFGEPSRDPSEYRTNNRTPY
jgi:hypothetical protein